MCCHLARSIRFTALPSTVVEAALFMHFKYFLKDSKMYQNEGKHVKTSGAELLKFTYFATSVSTAHEGVSSAGYRNTSLIRKQI